MKRALTGLSHVFALLILLSVAGVHSLKAQGSRLPALVSVPADLEEPVRRSLNTDKTSIEAELAKFQASAEAFNSKDASAQTDKEFESLQAEQRQYVRKANAFNARVADAARVRAGKASNFFSAVNERTLIAMSDGGHRIDGSAASVDGHGLVGGTAWTFGFKWPGATCGATCKAEIMKGLASQLALYCGSQSDPDKCVRDGLPFTPESYDFVVSMGSSHSAIEDLATRAIWDGPQFGEFSRKNKEIFAALKGRNFETLDCHSNGAMLCLAALRSGETTANEVRLFGPQITPAAAAIWQEYAAKTRTKITIYINNGDPITAASWKQPTPQTVVTKAATAAWLTNPVLAPGALADALFYTWLDSKKAVMDGALKGYGLDVKRFYPVDDVKGCHGSPALACHSMLLYEESLATLRSKKE